MSLEKAKSLIEENKLDEALKLLNEALEKNQILEPALLLRSKVYTRQSQLEPALHDAERAVVISKGSEKAQLRRAICLWRMKRVGEAKFLIKYFGKSQEAETWTKLLQQSNEPAVQIPRIPVKSAEHIPAPSPALQAKRPFRTDWFQTPQVVNLILYRKDLDPKTTKINIEAHRLSVVSTDNFDWSVDLGNEIVADQSSYELTPYKVEFKLQKLEPLNWNSLESKADGKPAVNPAPVAGKPTKPSALTSYSKWEHFEDEDKEKDDDPMKFFQNLYRDADPETQRAMMKSYIESNGTALSTNWEEVSKGKVETHPPRDFEARDWN